MRSKKEIIEQIRQIGQVNCASDVSWHHQNTLIALAKIEFGLWVLGASEQKARSISHTWQEIAKGELVATQKGEKND